MTKLQHYKKHFRDGISAVLLDWRHVMFPTQCWRSLRIIYIEWLRFSDLSGKDFPDWLTHFPLVELGDTDPILRADLQNDGGYDS